MTATHGSPKFLIVFLFLLLRITFLTTMYLILLKVILAGYRKEEEVEKCRRQCFLFQRGLSPIVLFLAGMELVSFIVVSMGPCFAFALTTVLITQECFSYCSTVLTQSGPFLLLTLPHLQVDWGCTTRWEVTQLAGQRIIHTV